MDHQHGTDPTPQGRMPRSNRRNRQNPTPGIQSEQYANSAPGPDVRRDGAYFLGFKNENAYQPEKEV